MSETNEPLLRVRDLRTYFRTDDGEVRAVDGVSFALRAGETFAIVGESGCGKSVTSFSILKLLPYPPAHHPGGRIEFQGDLLLDVRSGSNGRPRDFGYGESKMRAVRGGRIGMIFQEPMTSLNPVFSCGRQIVEAIQLHRPMPAREAKSLAIDLLDQVGIVNPAARFDSYPHQLSGGMRQRVMIAMALSCNPRLLIADEPTTALDVTIQAQILQLLRDLQQDYGLGMMLITHDLAVVAEVADRVAVMYASKLVETTDVYRLYEQPLHPYTQGLFRSVPKLGQASERLETIIGSVPNSLAFPRGCKFHPRCPVGRELQRCQTCEPDLREVRPGHWVACWETPGYEQAQATDPSDPDRLPTENRENGNHGSSRPAKPDL